MHRKKRCAVLLLTAALLWLVCGCTSPFYESTAKSEYAPEINPASDINVGGSVDVTLYYPMEGEEYLVAVDKTVDVASGERLETAIMRELLTGPTEDMQGLTAPFSSEVGLVSVTDDGQILYVTLSRDYLSFVSTSSYLGYDPKLSLAAMVNSLTENTSFQRVQLLIDTEGNGNGSRPTRQQAGLSGEAENTALEALTKDTELILTPQASVQILFQAAEEQDAQRLGRILAEDGIQARPGEDTLERLMQDRGSTIVSFSIQDEMISLDEMSAQVKVDIEIRTKEQGTQKMFGVGVNLLKEDSIWRVDYDSVQEILFPEN